MGVTTRILSDGRLVLIEPEIATGLVRRAFYRRGDSYDWCALDDLERNGTRARFYGYGPKELPDSMRCID